MLYLKNFQDFKEKTVNNNEDFYKSLKMGQSPDTLFITCSDSRIRPNHITGTTEGELFVIRNAGNALPRYGQKTDLATSATIEYAVLVLGIKQIVVCGHSHCGAIGARTEQADVPASCTSIHEYLNTLPEFPGKDVEENIRINIRTQLNRLLTYPYVKEAYDKGEIKLIGWLYHFEDGHLDVCQFPSTEFTHWEGHL